MYDGRAAVREAKAAGGSVREIAALINRSTNTVQRWLRG
ncbi:helix-turn-helix domain-containing protein [Mycobacteroides abscessus]